MAQQQDETGYFITNTADFQSLTEEELRSRLQIVVKDETDNAIATSGSLR